MSNDTLPREPLDERDGRTRQPYETPQLRVYGPVSAITATNSRDGRAKDGGPNNIKT